eukprot:648855_1
MDLQDQKIVVSQLYDQGHSELILGTTYYVACARWLHKWRAFVNCEARASPDNSSGSEDEAAQAPEFLDNSALVVPIGKDRIKMGLLEHEDYELIPESVWKQLTKWYKPNIEFKRKVLMDSNGQLSVEIWPLHFRLFVCKTAKLCRVILCLWGKFVSAARLLSRTLWWHFRRKPQFPIDAPLVCGVGARTNRGTGFHMPTPDVIRSFYCKTVISCRMMTCCSRLLCPSRMLLPAMIATNGHWKRSISQLTRFGRAPRSGCAH